MTRAAFAAGGLLVAAVLVLGRVRRSQRHADQAAAGACAQPADMDSRDVELLRRATAQRAV